MFNVKFFNPIKQIKIRQCFIYKIAPKTGIELNGLFRPSNIPFPFFWSFSFLLPFQLDFLKFQKKEVIDTDNVLHDVFELEVHKHFLYSMIVVYQLVVLYHLIVLILKKLP